jgi:hypothetical protein
MKCKEEQEDKIEDWGKSVRNDIGQDNSEKEHKMTETHS